jgi:hypothetical protein
MPRHCSPGCSHLHFSTLKNMGRSPAHYRYAATFGMEPSSAMNLGSAVHALVLEDGAGLVKYDGASRRGKEWNAFKDANADATILTASEWDEAHAIAASVRAHPRAAELLDGARETTFDWELRGRPCRGTTDVFRNHGLNRIVDLKTTSDAHPMRFQRTAERLGYFAQIPWYMTGARLAGLGEFDEGYIVAVETKPPYVVQTFALTLNALEMGERQWRSWIERLLVCEASDEWPGYQETDAALDLPDLDLELSIGGELVAVA